MSLNRLLIPFVTAEAGTQSLAEFSALDSRFRGCESFNLGDLARAQHAPPHGEEARAARRLEPWQHSSDSRPSFETPSLRSGSSGRGRSLKASQARKRGSSPLAEFSAPGFPLARERTEIVTLAGANLNSSRSSAPGLVWTASISPR